MISNTKQFFDEGPQPLHGDDPASLEDFFAAAPVALRATDAAGRIACANAAELSLLGYARADYIGRRFEDVFVRPREARDLLARLRTGNGISDQPVTLRRSDGACIDAMVSANPIFRRGRFAGTRDVTVLRPDGSTPGCGKADSRVLLDELNHRIKNNMQMLHGLLLASIHESRNAEARAILDDVGHRVGAMASAQRLLYKASDPKSFSASDFLHEVCGSLQHLFVEGTALRLHSDPFQLPNDVAIPLALILNELLTNAAKYGVGSSGVAEIAVRLTRKGDMIELVVEDNGRGFDLGPPGRRASGHGLVLGLARQLGGGFTVNRTTGAYCQVRFPITRKAQN